MLFIGLFLFEFKTVYLSHYSSDFRTILYKFQCFPAFNAFIKIKVYQVLVGNVGPGRHILKVCDRACIHVHGDLLLFRL